MSSIVKFTDNMSNPYCRFCRLPLMLVLQMQSDARFYIEKKKSDLRKVVLLKMSIAHIRRYGKTRCNPGCIQ